MFPQQAPISMTQAEPEPQASRFDVRSIIVGALVALAAIYVFGSLYYIHDLRTKVTELDQKQQALTAGQVELSNRLATTSTQFKQELSSEVGLTKQQMAERAAELQRAQEAAAARLSAAQSRQGKEI